MAGEGKVWLTVRWAGGLFGHSPQLEFAVFQ